MVATVKVVVKSRAISDVLLPTSLLPNEININREGPKPNVHNTNARKK